MTTKAEQAKLKKFVGLMERTAALKSVPEGKATDGLLLAAKMATQAGHVTPAAINTAYAAANTEGIPTQTAESLLDGILGFFTGWIGRVLRKLLGIGKKEKKAPPPKPPAEEDDQEGAADGLPDS